MEDSGLVAKILVADDDPDILELVCSFMEMAGHEVVAAEDGVQAYSALTLEPFDMAILDNSMPGMTGLEVISACRTLGPPKPVMVVLSALASRKDIRLGFIAGADDYIPKPFSREELVDRVQMLLDEREVDALTTTDAD